MAKCEKNIKFPQIQFSKLKHTFKLKSHSTAIDNISSFIMFY